MADIVQMLTRPPSAPPKLPPIPKREVDAVIDWLRSRTAAQRAPVATAKLLVLLVRLHERGEPLPSRGAMAEHLAISVALVDTALSQRTEEGVLSRRIESGQGWVKQRPSSVIHRYVDPCDELIRVVRKARPNRGLRT